MHHSSNMYPAPPFCTPLCIVPHPSPGIQGESSGEEREGEEGKRRRRSRIGRLHHYEDKDEKKVAV